MGDLSKSAQCVRIFLIIINILVFILGVIVFALGIYLVVNEENYGFITGSEVVGGAALFIIVGGVAMVITVVCIIAAIFRWRPILVLYAVVVTVIVILQIIAAILGFVFSDAVAGFVDERVIEAITLYRLEADMEFRSDVNSVVDYFQDTFDCCGYENASDWLTLNIDFVQANGNEPPITCNSLRCDASADNCENYPYIVNGTEIFSFNATTEGCRGDVATLLRVAGYTLGGVGIAFGIIEILGVLFALFFCCCISQARKQTVV